ncbi:MULTISPECIES: ribonuclease HI family protein [unclassified Massilia]|uniref:ribonuclease HI family protein n=1 Tax=unclassified Massilia TaxID=2609279 RepID=UPI00177B13DF|nr:MULTISPECIES: ribonuclease HI family protein [unclassified Massilia]MBD8532337.1 ribonuclease HI family protein [Massilia sp. CFBP 13647]MBD8673790.1 ribonuclease HI family protein [Massilia sp. CFBP 13721]
MTELDRLQGAANRTELSASRKLALRSSLSLEDALRATLTASSSGIGLEALLRERAVLRSAETARVLAREAAREAARAEQRTRHDGRPTAWRAWFDGSARPNPGRCGIGARLLGPGGELVELSQPAGYGNSSEAEYLALIAVLEAAAARGARELTVYGDSRVVIDDVAATAGAPSLHPYRVRVHALLARLPGASLRWVPRHKNLDADALSQRASLAATIEHDASLLP